MPGPTPPARQRSSNEQVEAALCGTGPAGRPCKLSASSSVTPALDLCPLRTPRSKPCGAVHLSPGPVGVVALGTWACFVVTAPCLRDGGGCALCLLCSTRGARTRPSAAAAPSKPWGCRVHASGAQSPPAGVSPDAGGILVPSCTVGERRPLSPGAMTRLHTPPQFPEAGNRTAVLGGSASFSPEETMRASGETEVPSRPFRMDGRRRGQVLLGKGA